MDDALRAQHLERITAPAAAQLYDRLCAACDARPGGMCEADQLLVRDVAMAEQIKGLLLDDIAQRGVGTERRNGSQRYYAENKSLAQLRAYTEQQRKLLSELRLTAASQGAVAVPVGDDFDTF